jgi:hypothetical protein
MSDEANNGQTDLDAVLERIPPEKRAQFLRSRLRLKQFEENDEILAIANYLDTVVILVDELTKNLSPRAQNAGELQTARREVNELTRAVKQLGEGIKDMESRFHLMDGAVETFTKIKRHQLWWAFAIAFMAGVLVLPVGQVVVEWVRGIASH